MNPAFEYIIPVVDVSLDGATQSKSYVSFVPLKILTKLLFANFEETPAELKTLQALEKANSPVHQTDDKSYHALEDIISKANIVINITSNVIFEPENNQASFPNQGRLRVPMDSDLFIINGIQTLSLLKSSVWKNLNISNTQIQVKFVSFSNSSIPQRDSSYAEMLERYESLEEPISGKDRKNLITRAVIDLVEIFRLLTDMSNSSLPPRSKYLFTFSSIRNATSALLTTCEQNDIRMKTHLAADYWTYICRLIPDWKRVLNQEDTAGRIRDNYIHSFAPTLLALGYLGASLIETFPESWEKRLKRISDINWDRKNPEWNGRVIIHGNISSTKKGAVLMCSYFKQFLEIPLTDEENELENQLINLRQLR